MFKTYLFFHLNLMFSSIEEIDRKKVIKKTYWPILKLAKSGFKLGIELTGISLEIIEKIDKEWIKCFKELLDQNKVELIGSGYSQIIGPIVPAKVNDYNIKLGNKVYKKLLGVEPEIALTNKCHSLQELLVTTTNNGYKSLIVEVNNYSRFNKSLFKDGAYPNIIIEKK